MAYKISAVWLAVSLLAISPGANAVLGGTVAAVTQDRIQSKASVRTPQGQNYTVHESLNQSGTTIREYAGADGKVFAITWSGPLIPDLRQLLGPYFPQYVADSGERKNGHTQRSIRQGDLVVHSGGRMRAFSGKAYLESAIPNGVEIDVLQ